MVFNLGSRRLGHYSSGSCRHKKKHLAENSDVAFCYCLATNYTETLGFQNNFTFIRFSLRNSYGPWSIKYKGQRPKKRESVNLTL